jgi:hypothetical protein
MDNFLLVLLLGLKMSNGCLIDSIYKVYNVLKRKEKKVFSAPDSLLK